MPTTSGNSSPTSSAGWSAGFATCKNAVTILYAAIGMLVATSLTVGLSAALDWALGWVPIGLGLCGASSLLFASVLLVREARLAVKATLLEMAYVRKVVARRTARPTG
jgi:hypothetical protein